MCFSAEASFIAAAGISVIGIVAVKKATKPALILLALVPFLFALQQFIEGLIWLNLQHWNTPGLKRVLVYSYLAIAYALWPIYSSIICFVFEKNKIRKLFMIITLIIGISLVFHAFMFMINEHTQAVIVNHSIYYTMHFPECSVCVAGMYIGSTCIPFLLSSHRSFNWFGILLILSSLLSFIVWRATYASVWCFFAAIISITMVWVISDLKKKKY